MHLLVVIYNPAEFFPPTLNAVEYFAKRYEKVTLLTHSLKNAAAWNFSSNVRAIYVKEWSQGSNQFENFYNFLRFTFRLRKILKQEKVDITLLYEPHAVLSYRIVLKLFVKCRWLLWYHNHDVFEINTQGRYSIGWWAVKSEQLIFPDLDIFSLPAIERTKYFPIDKLRGKFYFLPNYPARLLYDRYFKTKALSNNVNLIFQGRIGPGHGLEEIIVALKHSVGSKKLCLHLKGPVNEEYRKTLLLIAKANKVEKNIFFYGTTSYAEVPKLAATCDVGIAIHTKSSIMHSSLGTSSNKIYEYIAVGLPVLLFDNIHFRTHLDKYKWAVFTDCSESSLRNSLEFIVNNFEELSNEAHRDYVSNLNFERVYDEAAAYISTIKDTHNLRIQSN